MVKNHLSRLAAPKTFNIKRKQNKWLTRPCPGTHQLNRCITIDSMLRDLLSYAKTLREVKNIINSKKVEVDGRVIKDHHFPIGIMDTVSIKDANEYFRVLINNKGKIYLSPISKTEATLKPLKIIKKSHPKNKKIQLNFFDGRNLIVDNNSYKVSDTVLFDLKNKTIKSHIKFAKGNLVYFTSGVQKGNTGTIESERVFNSSQKTILICKRGKDKFETLKDYAFVIGTDKPIIKISNEKQ